MLGDRRRGDRGGPGADEGGSPASRRAVRLAVGAYRVALVRYPRALRSAYESEMVEALQADLTHRFAEKGWRGLGEGLWLVTRDLFRPLPGPIRGVRVQRLGDASGAPPAGGGAPGRQASGRKAMGRDGGDGMTGRTIGSGWIEDFGFAWRSLAREPRFSVLVTGLLGIGIALNATSFAAVNAYLLKPLPFPEPDRLVAVRDAEALSWTEVGDVFDLAVSWDLDVFTLLGDGSPEMASGAWVTPDFLEAYGVRPALGRTFLSAEAGRYAAPVAMISHRLWQARFGGDPDVVGRAFTAFTSDRPDHAESFTIVGVLPADFWYLNDYTDVLAPIREDRAVYTGRLRRDVPPARAEQMLTDLSIRRMEHVPPGFRVRVERLQDAHVASLRPTLFVLQAAVLLVFLVACANAAVLLLVRSTRRARELGLRTVLGASGGRLARQLGLEGAIVAAGAAITGLATTWLALDLGRTTMEARLGRSVPGGADALALDVSVVAAAVVFAAGVGLLFGLVPLAVHWRRGCAGGLGDGRRGATESRARRRLRSVLVAGEVALSLALLLGAGLMVRSALYLQGRPLGFDPNGITRVVVGLREASYPEVGQRVEVFERIRERVRGLPAVQDVGLVSSGLFTTRFGLWPVEGLSGDVVDRAEAVRWTVDDRYFEVLGIRVVRGRGFNPEDRAGTTPVAVVSESLARDLWGEGDPIGRGIRLPPMTMAGMAPEDPGPWLQVVGVVSDVVRDVDGPEVGDLYMSFGQQGALWMNLMARAQTGFVEPLESLIEAAVHELDPDAPVASPLHLSEAVQEARRPTRYIASLLSGFSAFALLLAVIGLYGVIAYAARQRARDIAIRMALGADSSTVTGLFVRQGLLVVLAGIAVGSGGGIALGRALEGQLHGVRAGDPETHLLVTGLLCVATVLAVLVPALRAARADPMTVLRDD